MAVFIAMRAFGRMVKAQRHIVSPNFNFLGQLLDYERALNLTGSPSSAATGSAAAGVKRKRFRMSLTNDSVDH